MTYPDQQRCVSLHLWGESMRIERIAPIQAHVSKRKHRHLHKYAQAREREGSGTFCISSIL